MSRSTRRWLAMGTLASLTALSAMAHGAQSHGHDESLQFAQPVSGHQHARTTRTTTGQVPRAMTARWQGFTQDAGGWWMASWDEATGIPNRIWGRGISAPGTTKQAVAAERFSRAMLTRHLSLVAPGAAAGDFELVSNELHQGVRSVGFVQRRGGLEVVGGQVSFRFKNDRMVMISSQALPFVRPNHLAPAGLRVADDEAVSRAREWMIQSGNTLSDYAALAEPVILPLVSEGNVLAYRSVVPVELKSTAPLGQWTVYVDAIDGQPVAREQTLQFVATDVLYNVPERYPLDKRVDLPAREAGVVLDGKNQNTSVSGTVDVPQGQTQSLKLGVIGPRVRVDNTGGAEANVTVDITGGQPAVWNASNNEIVDAQLSAFVHTQVAQAHALALNPALSFAKQQMRVNVNIQDQCNAFYNGQSINFFLSSQACANTAQLADVVYHEFGHAFHNRSIQQGVGAYDKATGEAVADYFSSSITNDSGMGRGFFNNSKPLREIDPEGYEYAWPGDIASDPHSTGLILGGALWDLRKAMVEKLGQDEGAKATNALFAQVVRTATDIPSVYSELLVIDDDDGNLENGTPNICEINRAFGPHGLQSLTMIADTPGVEPPTIDGKPTGHEVSLRVNGLFEQCDDDKVKSARVEWRLQRKPNQVSFVDMEGTNNEFAATIPAQQSGEVVLYKVRLDLGSGASVLFPDNRADPQYQFFVGEVIPLYCTDFETDPELEGWVHGLKSGSQSEGADDWQWNTPKGTSANGDPSKAFSGERVYGNDLGHGNFNGLYQGDKTTFTTSPVIDTKGYDNVRIQFRRWLNVEDGFFDQANIYANDNRVWTNLASVVEDDATVHHQDKEWRFVDIDISSQVSDGNVQVEFELDSDQGFHLGGWTLDDFCVVAYDGPAPVDAECGNGKVELGEQCDDGNLVSGDGCNSSCRNEAGPSDPQITPEEPASMGRVDVKGCGCRLKGKPESGQTPWSAALVALGAALFGLRRRRR